MKIESIFKQFLLLLVSGFLIACSSDNDLLPIVVYVEGHSMSKLPFVIAADQQLYEKHGLDLEFRMPPPEFEGGRQTTAPLWLRAQRRLGIQPRPEFEILVTGHTPTMYRQTNTASGPPRLSLASTDCSIRYYVIAAPGIETLEDIKGKRIGLNRIDTTSGFAGLRLIERMGWDRQFDVSILENGRSIEQLKNNQVDVVVGSDVAFEAAMEEGFKILVDTRTWNESLAGNSVLVQTGWLEQGQNREIATRFLKAALEGLSLFHQQPELAVDVAMRWYGIPTIEMARGRLERADYVPRIPYPCYEGIANTMRIHDSHEMRKYEVEDFYDDSILRELEESGFIEALYPNSYSNSF